MTKATKAKLTSLQSTVDSLYASATAKDSKIKLLTFGIIAVVGVVLFLFFMKRRRR